MKHITSLAKGLESETVGTDKSKKIVTKALIDLKEAIDPTRLKLYEAVDEAKEELYNCNNSSSQLIQSQSQSQSDSQKYQEECNNCLDSVEQDLKKIYGDWFEFSKCIIPGCDNREPLHGMANLRCGPNDQPHTLCLPCYFKLSFLDDRKEERPEYMEELTVICPLCRNEHKTPICFKTHIDAESGMI
jgi:hypothetical protein